MDGGWVGESKTTYPCCSLPHQDLVSHLLDLLGFGLDVVLQLVLPALHHLQTLHLVL